MLQVLSSSSVPMQAAGWIVIILFGFLFALLAVFLVRSLSYGHAAGHVLGSHAEPSYLLARPNALLCLAGMAGVGGHQVRRHCVRCSDLPFHLVFEGCYNWMLNLST